MKQSKISAGEVFAAASASGRRAGSAHLEGLEHKYRPQSLDEVIGQAHVVEALRALPHVPKAVLLTGPSGVGKTTLARILARQAGCSGGLIEIDGATHTGIDAIRRLTGLIRYRALGESPVKVVILDEADALSSSAVKSLLKAIEEPPSHVYWILCTTEFHAIPETIRTRCRVFHLRSVHLTCPTSWNQ